MNTAIKTLVNIYNRDKENTYHSTGIYMDTRNYNAGVFHLIEDENGIEYAYPDINYRIERV